MALPLPTLLSQTLVAFTIEADYEFELRMPHFTTEARTPGGKARGPFLISLPFYSMCLAHVPETGSSAGDVIDRGFLDAGFLLGVNPGMVRWGYLKLEPGDSTSKRPTRSWTVRLRPAGLLAKQTWAPIPLLIEQRWQERWPTVSRLRRRLEEVVSRFDHALPDHVPINGGYQNRVSIPPRPADPVVDRVLSALLAKALVQFTLEVEHLSPLPMVHAANISRVLRQGPVARRDLPRATGVAKETLAVMVGILGKRDLVASAADGFVLTAKGRDAADATFAAVAQVEARWNASGLRDALEPLVGDGTLAGSVLRLAVEPPDGTWRRKRSAPITLPHHPVVSHRGGYPDGA